MVHVQWHLYECQNSRMICKTLHCKKMMSVLITSPIGRFNAITDWGRHLSKITWLCTPFCCLKMSKYSLYCGLVDWYIKAQGIKCLKVRKMAKKWWKAVQRCSRFQAVSLLFSKTVEVFLHNAENCVTFNLKFSLWRSLNAPFWHVLLAQSTHRLQVCLLDKIKHHQYLTSSSPLCSFQTAPTDFYVSQYSATKLPPHSNRLNTVSQ